MAIEAAARKALAMPSRTAPHAGGLPAILQRADDPCPHCPTSVNITIWQFVHLKTRSWHSAVCLTIRMTLIGSTQVGHEGVLPCSSAWGEANIRYSIAPPAEQPLLFWFGQHLTHIAVEIRDGAVEPGQRPCVIVLQLRGR